MYRGAFVLQDDSDPALHVATRRLADRPAARSRARTASRSRPRDAGGGLYEAIIEVDGQHAVAQSLGCSLPFTATVPCKLTASGTVTLDTAALADGAHSVRVLVTRRDAVQHGRVRAVHDHDLERADERAPRPSRRT